MISTSDHLEHHQTLAAAHRNLASTCQKAADACEVHNELHPSEVAKAAMDCFGEMSGHHSSIADQHDAVADKIAPGARRPQTGSESIERLRRQLEG